MAKIFIAPYERPKIKKTCSTQKLVEDHIKDLFGVGIADRSDRPDAGEEKHSLEEGGQLGLRLSLQLGSLHKSDEVAVKQLDQWGHEMVLGHLQRRVLAHHLANEDYYQSLVIDWNKKAYLNLHYVMMYDL